MAVSCEPCTVDRDMMTTSAPTAVFSLRMPHSLNEICRLDADSHSRYTTSDVTPVGRTCVEFSHRGLSQVTMTDIYIFMIAGEREKREHLPPTVAASGFDFVTIRVSASSS